MTSDTKLDPSISKISSRLGLSMVSGDLPQSTSEATKLSVLNPFSLLASFPKPTSEALAFLESIDESDLRYLLFDDNLSIVTADTGKVVGEFQMSVTFGGGKRHPMLTVKASSIGTIDSVPCGTSITARLSPQLETLEQRIHEYVKLEGYLLDRVTDVIKERENYTIYRVVTKGEKQEKTEFSAGILNMRGFISEGASLLLQKLFIKKGVPDNCQFITTDYDATICPVVYKALGQQMEKIGETEIDTKGIERIVKANRDPPVTCQSFYDNDGHLLSRVQIDAPVRMKLLTPLVRTKEDISATFLAPEPAAIRTIDWENDVQLYSQFLDRKEELVAGHMTYINQTEAVRQLMADFMQALLLDKPSDIATFAAQYFSFHSSEGPEVFRGSRRDRSSSLSYSNPLGLKQTNSALDDGHIGSD